jgi:hypothetical protein
MGELIKPASRDVFLHLPIPDCGIKLGKPRSKCRQILWREPADSVFNILNLAHGHHLRLTDQF